MTRTEKRELSKRRRTTNCPVGLTGYLVVVKGYHDDVPVGLFEDLPAATRFAKELQDDNVDEASTPFCAVRLSSIVGVAILEFRRGCPYRLDCVDDECDDGNEE
jgi:hypothetical protein